MLENTFQLLKLNAISQHSSSHRGKELMPSRAVSRNPSRHKVSQGESNLNETPIA